MVPRYDGNSAHGILGEVALIVATLPLCFMAPIQQNDLFKQTPRAMARSAISEGLLSQAKRADVHREISMSRGGKLRNRTKFPRLRSDSERIKRQCTSHTNLESIVTKKAGSGQGLWWLFSWHWRMINYPLSCPRGRRGGGGGGYE